MKTLRMVAGILGFGNYLLGCLLSYDSPAVVVGPGLMLTGAVLIAALLISSSIAEKHKGG